MRPLPIIQFNEAGDPLVWTAATFKEALGDGDVSHTHMRKQFEGKFEQLIHNNLSVLGIYELSDKRFKYKSFLQCPLPRRNGSAIQPDIIVIREDGELFIIEVKLEYNTELFNRKAIGQVIEYASAVSALTEVELTNMLNSTNDDFSLGELFDHWFGPSSPYRIQNRINLVNNIAAGKINMLIVSDILPSGAYDWINDWTSKSHLPFNFSAIEVTPFKNSQNNSILLIPQTKVKTEIISRTVVELKQQDGNIKAEITINSAAEIEQNQKRITSEKIIFIDTLNELIKQTQIKTKTQIKYTIKRRSSNQEQIVFIKNKYVSALRLYLNEDGKIIDWLVWIEYGSPHIDPDDKVLDAIALVKADFDNYKINFDKGPNTEYRGAGISSQHSLMSTTNPNTLGQTDQPVIEDTEALRDELSTLYAAFIKAHLAITAH
jgi:hypothetical protein